MERSQKIEEALSVVWEERENGVYILKDLGDKIRAKVGEDMTAQLIREGYFIAEGDKLQFAKKGESIARDVIRRQRLAERLLVDVLELGRSQMDSSACELEHILSKEVEESICTLLGHPTECPHGLPIPSGECCAKAKDLLGSIVIPLSRLTPGEVGRVVYVLTHKHPQLHKLLALGITPGARVVVHQTFPSVIIQAEETQVALEEDVAKGIYVKRLQTV